MKICFKFIAATLLVLFASKSFSQSVVPPDLAEAEKAFADLVCGSTSCGPSIKLSSSKGSGIVYGGFPDSKARLIGAIYSLICENDHVVMVATCDFSKEVSIGMTNSIKSQCGIDYHYLHLPRPLALNYTANIAQIQSCIVWAGLSHVVSQTSPIPYCSEEDYSIVNALVEVNQEFTRTVFLLDELSDNHRNLMNLAFLTQLQLDKREIKNRLSRCEDLEANKEDI